MLETRWQGGVVGSAIAVAVACAVLLVAGTASAARPIAKEVAAKPASASEIKQLRKRGKTCLVTGKVAPPRHAAKPGTQRAKAALSSCGASGGQAKGDFNNDGFADLAVGAPGEDVGTMADAGSVTVVYGSANGLNLTGNAQTFDQTVLNTPNGAAQPGDRFGSALASGDFNGDGFGDLAVGVPGNQLGSTGNPDLEAVGEVDVLFGSATGLSASKTQFIENRFGAIPTRSNFGASLAWGQYGGGPEADLAVGSPGSFGQGSVIAFRGSPTGLVEPKTFFLGSVTGVSTDQESIQFGSELTGADFNGDGFADLAVAADSLDLNAPAGSPGTEVAGSFISNAGAVVVLNGSAAGLTTAGALFLRQGRDGLADQPETSDFFGSAVTGGDLNGDGFADLAIGARFEEIEGGASGAGAVHVLFGSKSGLTTANNRFIVGTVASGSFGAALVTGNLQGDGVADLVVGQPAAGLSTFFNSGQVHVYYGTAAGGLASTGQVWNLDTAGVAGAAQSAGDYGSSLTAWNFGKTAEADLVIGSPGADVGTVDRAGGFGVLYGTPTGVTATGSQFLTQNSVGIPGTAQEFDSFGVAAY